VSSLAAALTVGLSAAGDVRLIDAVRAKNLEVSARC
jgi:hypothetical protein